MDDRCVLTISVVLQPPVCGFRLRAAKVILLVATGRAAAALPRQVLGLQMRFAYANKAAAKTPSVLMPLFAGSPTFKTG